MSYKAAIPTMSLGHGAAGHTLHDKLHAAKDAGFRGIEVFFMDLQADAKRISPSSTPDQDSLRKVASETSLLAKELGLEIIVLQPILNYEGVKDKKEHSDWISEIKFRMELCDLLETDMMQIPANFRLDDGVSGDPEDIARDLRELADIGASRSNPIRFVYEAMCWSTFNYTWQQGWEIVQKVDRPNFGIVLDAFHIAGYEFADPTVEGGIREGGMERLKKSCKELVATIPGDRIFYIQLVDAEKVTQPITKEGGSPYYQEGLQPRMCWSRNCRVYPYETDRGGYMPIEMVAKAFIDTGFQGWISFELFNRFINTSDPSIPVEHAKRGWQSWLRLADALKLA